MSFVLKPDQPFEADFQAIRRPDRPRCAPRIVLLDSEAEPDLAGQMMIRAKMIQGYQLENQKLAQTNVALNDKIIMLENQLRGVRGQLERARMKLRKYEK